MMMIDQNGYAGNHRKFPIRLMMASDPSRQVAGRQQGGWAVQQVRLIARCG